MVLAAFWGRKMKHEYIKRTVKRKVMFSGCNAVHLLLKHLTEDRV